MSQDQKKQRAAAAALEYIQPGTIIGVGTGSTVNFFIDALAGMPRRGASEPQPENNTFCRESMRSFAQFTYIRQSVYGRGAFA